MGALFGSESLLPKEAGSGEKGMEGLLTTGFEVFNRWFKSWDGTSWEMSTGTANFIAGGLASNVYWWTALRESSVSL